MNVAKHKSLREDCIIEKWPNQEGLTVCQQDTLGLLFQEIRPMVSELSFAGLFIFSNTYDYKICEIEDTIMITGKDKYGKFAVFPFEAPSATIISTLIENQMYIKTIPQMYKRNLLANIPRERSYKSVADAGDFDYIYTRKSLEWLPGRKYHKKRNLINLFLKTYSNHSTEAISTKNISDVLQILNIWETHHSDEDDDYAANKVAIANYFDLPLFGQITYVNDSPAGFVIGELRNNQLCAIIHFEKADVQYSGIYQYINQKFAASLPVDCQIINREQDLGKEGLRQAKNTYRPVTLLKKYRVFFNDRDLSTKQI